MFFQIRTSQMLWPQGRSQTMCSECKHVQSFCWLCSVTMVIYYLLNIVGNKVNM